MLKGSMFTTHIEICTKKKDFGSNVYFLKSRAEGSDMNTPTNKTKNYSP
jgi:hypothetical protein